MPLYRPSELKALLESMGTSPKKRYSQNFLIDGNIVRKIAELADIKPGDEVLEIGPGPGALTEILLEKGARILAIEKDPIWAAALERLGGDITVIGDDVLACPLKETIEAWKKQPKIKIVANLPYHITTPILTTIAPMGDLLSEIIVMVQDEVAQRFSAPHGSREYGSITLFLNFWSKVEYGFKVKRSSFYPSPNVDSALIKLTLKEVHPNVDVDRFFEFTRKAFGQRRKMLKVSLKELLTPEQITANLTILQKRPEALSLDDFIELFAKISSDK